PTWSAAMIHMASSHRRLALPLPRPRTDNPGTRLLLGELGIDALECVADLLAEDRDDHHDDGRDQGYQQAVLHGGRSTVFASAPAQVRPPSSHSRIDVQQPVPTSSLPPPSGLDWTASDAGRFRTSNAT